MELRRRALGDEHPDVARSLTNLASVLQARATCGAEPLFRESLATAPGSRRRHPDVARSLNNLALCSRPGRPAGAEPLFRESLRSGARLWRRAPGRGQGREQPRLLLPTGRSGRAEPLYRESLAIFATPPATSTRSGLEPEQPRRPVGRQGRARNGRALLRESLAIASRSFGTRYHIASTWRLSRSASSARPAREAEFC